MLNYLSIFLLPFFSAIAAWLLSMLGFRLLLKRLYTQRTALAARITQNISGDFFNAASIQEKLADPSRLAAVKPIIETHVNTFLNIKLQEKLPVIAMFASPDMLAKIKEGLLEEIDLLLPEVISQYAGSALEGLDPKTIIIQKINSMPEEQTKELIWQLIGKERTRIALFAALFGFIVGIIPLLLFFL